MMSNVLTVEQREQAGSDSYNRFELILLLRQAGKLPVIDMPSARWYI